MQRRPSWGPSLVCVLVVMATGSQLLHAALGCGHHTQHAKIQQSASEHLAWRDSMKVGEQNMTTSHRRSLLPSRPGFDIPVGAAPQPIRVALDFSQLDQLDVASQELLRTISATVVDILQKYIQVRRPVSGRLLVPPQCRAGLGDTCLAPYPDFASTGTDLQRCGLANIRREHILDSNSCVDLGEGRYDCKSVAGTLGEETDLYLYVTAFADKDCESGAAAWARPCLYDPVSNRPILAGVNMCPAALVSNTPDQSLAIATHELIHALGFTSSMFDLFIDSDGQPLPPGSVLQVQQGPGRSGNRLVTPTVRREVQQQFGCPDLTGAPLEEQGGDGSAGSHFEYELFQGELMVASSMFSADGQPPRLSRLTLALLEDSGWYYGNWDEAGPLLWGLNAGCSFVNDNCATYMSANPDQNYFCTPSAAGEAARAASGSCTASLQSQALSCQQLNFTSPGCGLKLARGSSAGVEANCLLDSYEYPNADVFGWVNGPSSRCYTATYKFTAQSSSLRYTFPASGNLGDTDGVCFPSSCDSDGRLYVEVFGNRVACPQGSTIDLAAVAPSRYQKGLLGPCPDNAAMCRTLTCGPRQCQPGGDCLNGRCICKLAFGGPDCALDLMTGRPVVGPPTSDDPGGGSGLPPLESGNRWVQVVQMTMTLSTTANVFRNRQQRFIAALAAWSSSTPAQIKVNITGGGPASDGAPTGGLVRRLTQAAPTLQVIAEIQPSALNQTEALVAIARDPAEVERLYQLVKTQAGLEMDQSSFQSQVIVRQLDGTRQPARPGSPGAAVDESSSSASIWDKITGNTVAIVAIAVGGTVAVVAIVSIIVAVCRSRRAAKAPRAPRSRPQPQPAVAAPPLLTAPPPVAKPPSNSRRHEVYVVPDEPAWQPNQQWGAPARYQDFSRV